MATGKDLEGETELTIEDFIALLRYINRKLEELNREAARYRRAVHKIGRPEDLVSALLASTLSPGLGVQAEPATGQTSVAEDQALKEKAKKLARRLRGVETLEGQE